MWKHVSCRGPRALRPRCAEVLVRQQGGALRPTRARAAPRATWFHELTGSPKIGVAASSLRSSPSPALLVPGAARRRLVPSSPLLVEGAPAVTMRARLRPYWRHGLPIRVLHSAVSPCAPRFAPRPMVRLLVVDPAAAPRESQALRQEARGSIRRRTESGRGTAPAGRAGPGMPVDFPRGFGGGRFTRAL